MSAAPLPTLAEAGRKIAAGELSPVALTEAALARAEALQPEAGRLYRDHRRARPRRREARGGGDRRRPAARPAARHPVRAQGHLRRRRVCARPRIRGCCSTTSRRPMPTTTARLEAAGMVLIGKLATHEFAIGGPAFDLPFPPARNPWNTDAFHRRLVESGSGAAVAAGIVRAGDGSRHRRLDPPAGGVLRHGRAEADLRPGQPARRRAAVLHASTLPGR